MPENSKRRKQSQPRPRENSQVPLLQQFRERNREQLTRIGRLAIRVSESHAKSENPAIAQDVKAMLPQLRAAVSRLEMERRTSK